MANTATTNATRPERLAAIEAAIEAAGRLPGWTPGAEFPADENLARQLVRAADALIATATAIQPRLGIVEHEVRHCAYLAKATEATR